MVITRSQDLRTIAPLCEVLMSIEAVVPAISGSFVYEGCYRPRGALTFAERSAWGLRSSANRPSVTNSNAPTPMARASARQTWPVTCAQLRPQVATHCRTSIEKRLKRKRRFRAACLSSAALRCANRHAGAQHLAKPSRFAGWFRLSVEVGGWSATCLLARGRSFVTGDMRAKLD